MIAQYTIPTNRRYTVRCLLKAPIFKPQPIRKLYIHVFTYDKMYIKNLFIFNKRKCLGC